MAKAALPAVVRTDTFHLYGVKVTGYTLSDGQRVIEQESMHRLIAAMEVDAGGPVDPHNDEVLRFSRWRAGE